MQDTEIQEILRRSGVQTEGKVKTKPLDKFENKIVDIALRLVNDDDDLDPAHAGMDILDAVNDKMMTESWERRAGTWYDPYKRALEILAEYMDEDAFADMRARMAAQADDYLKQRDSSFQHAELEPQDADEPEPTTPFGQAAKSLDEIRKLAIRDNYTIGSDSIAKLDEIIRILQQADADAQKPSMADRARGIAQKARSHFTKRQEPANVRKARRQAQRQARRVQRRSLRSDIGESVSDTTLRQVVPELRGIAVNFVNCPNAKQRMMEIAAELSEAQDMQALWNNLNRAFGAIRTTELSVEAQRIMSDINKSMIGIANDLRL